MALGKYILNHSEVSYYVSGTGAQEITYKDDKCFVNENHENDILQRDNKTCIDYKFSFDNINFESEEDAKEKLNEVAKQISKIEIEGKYYKKWKAKFPIKDESDLKIKEILSKYENKNIEVLNQKIVVKDDKKYVEFDLKKTYYRKVNMKDTVIAVHTKSLEEKNNIATYKVNPHIHIVYKRNKSFGKNTAYLQKEIVKILNKNNLISSLNSNKTNLNMGKKEKQEYTILKNRLTAFSWVVAKHSDKKYIYNDLKKIKGSNLFNVNAVTLKNLKAKIERYIELGGSKKFVEKLKFNLKNKLNFNLSYKENFNEERAKVLLEKKDYSQIIKEISQKAMKQEKIPEAYREFSESVAKNKNSDIRDIYLAKGIKEIYVESRFVYNDKYERVIDKEKIEITADKYLKDINKINENFERVETKEPTNNEINTKEEFKNTVSSKIYLTQNELREDMKKYNISSSELEAITGKSEVKIVYESNVKYIANNLDKEKLKEEISKGNSRNYIRNEIEKNPKLKLNENWKEKISDTINDNIVIKSEIKEKINNEINLKEEFKNIVSSKIYLTQNELREDMKKYNITSSELEAITGKSEVKIVYESNVKYIINNLDKEKLKEEINKGNSRNYIRNEIEKNPKLKLNENWKEKISDTINDNVAIKSETKEQTNNKNIVVKNIKKEIEELSKLKKELIEKIEKIENEKVGFFERKEKKIEKINRIKEVKNTINNINYKIDKMETEIKNEYNKVIEKTEKLELKEDVKENKEHNKQIEKKQMEKKQER